jgi:hypothetical protein
MILDEKGVCRNGRKLAVKQTRSRTREAHVQVCVATLKHQITLATASMRVLEQVDTQTLRMEDVTRIKLAKVYQVRD